jgi:cytochrome c553
MRYALARIVGRSGGAGSSHPMIPSTRRFTLILLCSLATALAAPTAKTVGKVAASTGAESMRAARRELEAIGRLVPDPAQGQLIFQRCAVCHGAPAADLPEGWVPQIAGQHPRVIAKELLDYRLGLRWDVRMELVAGRHVLRSDQEIADVAAYAGTLSFKADAAGDAEHTERDKARYRRLCFACHGPAGAGSNARAIPRLGGQDRDYLLRQLHDALEGRRPNMAPVHARLLKRLNVTELEGLADYLSRLTRRGSAPYQPSLTAQR